MKYAYLGTCLRLSEEEYTFLLGLFQETLRRMESLDISEVTRRFMKSDFDVFYNASYYHMEGNEFLVKVSRKDFFDLLSNLVFHLSRKGKDVFCPGDETRKLVLRIRERRRCRGLNSPFGWLKAAFLLRRMAADENEN